MKNSILFLIFIVCSFSTTLEAQIFNHHNLTGSLETNNKYYFDDNLTGAERPSGNFGSNSYLQLNYTSGKISTGLQYEAYLPPLLGYNSKYDHSDITHKYLTYRDKKLTFTVGNFYEQFGSGLLFRAWEDRQLGLNNSIEGINIHFKPTDYIYLKAVYGKQRTYFTTADSKIRGIDAEIYINQHHKTNINIGLGIIQRYEAYTGALKDFPETTTAYSGRMNLRSGIVDLSCEYVYKGKDGILFGKAISSEGSALLINNSYSFYGFGANISLRRLENMNFRGMQKASNNELLLNYLPSNTKQQTYSLASLHPYATVSMGEIGGQLDLYYTLKRNSSLGGKYGTQIAFNFSKYFKLEGKTSQESYYTESSFIPQNPTALYYNYNLELKKKWSKRFKSSLSYIKQMYNKTELEGTQYEIIKSDIIAANLLFTFNNRNSLKIELQHLSSQDDDKNWASTLLEFSTAKRWSLYASDMYNYGKTNIHYTNFGIAYNKGTSRMEFSYGRQRKGLICVGGVCRLVPAATALSFNLSKTF